MKGRYWIQQTLPQSLVLSIDKAMNKNELLSKKSHGILMWNATIAENNDWNFFAITSCPVGYIVNKTGYCTIPTMLYNML